MSNSSPYLIGDRVRVSKDWFVEEVRGAIGRIALPPDCIPNRRVEGIYWVEFEEPWLGDDPLYPVDASEIDAESLGLLEP